MTSKLDVSNAINVAKGLLANSKDPVRDMSDILALYRAYQTATAGGGIGTVARAMDRDGLLVPAAQALADLAPEILPSLEDPKQKQAIFTLLDSL